MKKHHIFVATTLLICVGIRAEMNRSNEETILTHLMSGSLRSIGTGSSAAKFVQPTQTAGIGYASNVLKDGYENNQPVNPTSAESNGNAHVAFLASAAILAQTPNDFGERDNAGLFLGPKGHANWGIVQTNVRHNPTEWQVYGSQAQGFATSVSGTDQLVSDGKGAEFAREWIDLPYFYFNGARYKLSVVKDRNHATVKNVDGSPVTFPQSTTEIYNFVATTANAKVNLIGNKIFWISGQKFMPFSGGNFCCVVNINGALYDYIEATDTTILLASSAGAQLNVPATQYFNINDQISTMRLQKFSGTTEENLSFFSSARGNYQIRALIAGNGKYRPIYIGSGASNKNGLYNQFVAQDDGTASIGGGFGSDVLRVGTSDPSVGSNYIFAGKATSGVGVSLAARSNVGDTKVNFGYDALGTGSHIFTSHAWKNVEFKIAGAGATDYVTASSGPGQGILSTDGASANSDLRLSAKGAGVVEVSGRALTVSSGADPGLNLAQWQLTSGTFAGNIASYQLGFYTGANGDRVERVRIDNGGNVGFNSDEFGSGVKVISIGTASTVPTSNPVGAFVLYVDPADGKLKARGPLGTITTIANP